MPSLSEYKKKAKNGDKIDAIKLIKNKVNRFLGINFNPENIYYIEEEALDVDLNKSKILLKRYAFDITSTAIGLSFLITIIISWIIPIDSSNWYVLAYSAIGLAFLAPLLVSLLIPILWTLEDSAIKSIDLRHKIKPLGFKIRERIFDRFMGKGGIIMGFTIVLNHITDINEEVHLFTNFQKFLYTILMFIGLMIIMGIPCILSTIHYLQNYHQENVNLTRNVLKTVLPTGLTVVKKGKSN